MGRLVQGEWKTGVGASTGADGSFQRQPVTFRNWITPDGAPGPTGGGGFAADAGRYRLYVSYACPWAHRTLIYRVLRGLEKIIEIDVVHPDMLEDGWTLSRSFEGATGDRLYGLPFLRDLYVRADPAITARATVPVLWDTARNTIVSNESAEIIRMFDSAFNGLTGNRATFYPPALRAEIDAVNARVYDTLNNGVYRAGFARSQQAYDTAVGELFDTLDWLEERLGQQRYVAGAHITEADWRLFPTLVRFDAVYHLHFKCSWRRLVEYPNLWAYARELYQWPGIAETVDMAHIRRHYFRSHTSINPAGIIPLAPEADWQAPHGRDALGSA